MGITAKQWIKIYYMAVFILDPCVTQCELWQHLLFLTQWHMCRGMRRITFRRMCCKSNQRRGLGSGLSTCFQARLTWLCNVSSQGVGTSLVLRRILYWWNCISLIALRTCASSGLPKTNGSGSVQLYLESKSYPAFPLWVQRRSKPWVNSRNSLGAGNLTDLSPQERLLQQVPHCCSLLVA